MINDMMTKSDYDKEVNLLRLQILEFLVSGGQSLQLNSLIEITKDQTRVKGATTFPLYIGLISITHEVIACLESVWKDVGYNTPLIVVANWEYGMGNISVF